MTEPQEERALFASALAALRFALNFEDSSIPAPIMNREMALNTVDKAKAEAQTRAYSGTARRASATTMVRPSVALGGTQDRSIMAGWILQRFQQLEVTQRLVLILTVQRPRVPCFCGSQCCRGWTLKFQWVEAVRILVEHLRDRAGMDKEPGKRGFSTDPRLRVALIEDYAKPTKRRASLQDLARMADVTTTTAATHRARIHGYLEETERLAWAELAAIFDAHGITGVVTD